MSTKTFHGSCLCGAIKFEVDLDLAAGTHKCNCTGCWKRRLWGAKAKTEGFRALAGDDQMTRYRPGSPSDNRGFCRACGLMPYARVDAAEWNDGAYVSINVACLDDLDPRDLLAAPITHYDGRADAWHQKPEITAHL